LLYFIPQILFPLFRARKLWRKVSHFFLGLFFIVIFLVPSLGIASPTEYELKAIFIERFAQFTEWPPNKFENNLSPFIISIIGDSPLKQAFESLKVDSFQNRKLILKQIFVLDQSLQKSHIVFISASESYRLKEILSLLSGSKVLTIGEFEGFTESEGMINLISNNNKIGFEVNNRKAKEGKISISSKVLRLAKKVY
jgi:hypothetical protein